MKHVAYDQFGLGKPIRSTVCGLVVSVKELRMTEIPNECVGFVGPEDTSKWNMVLDFPRAQLRSGVKAVVEAYSVQL